MALHGWLPDLGGVSSCLELVDWVTMQEARKGAIRRVPTRAYLMQRLLLESLTIERQGAAVAPLVGHRASNPRADIGSEMPRRRQPLAPWLAGIIGSTHPWEMSILGIVDLLDQH